MTPRDYLKSLLRHSNYVRHQEGGSVFEILMVRFDKPVCMLIRPVGGDTTPQKWVKPTWYRPAAPLEVLAALAEPADAPPGQAR